MTDFIHFFKVSRVKKYILCLWGVFLLPSIPGCVPASPPDPIAVSESPQRLISTVPSITELLFDIGLGERIVGDSRFTSYPPEAKKIEKIGGLYDLSWEKLALIKPDLVFLLVENDSVRHRLAGMRLECLSVNHQSLAGIAESYEKVGRRMGPEILEIALKKQAAFLRRLDDASVRKMPEKPPRIMICLDRTRGIGRIQNLFIAGNLPIFEEVIRRAGGTNVGSELGIPVPSLSAEGILRLNPDVIIDLLTGEGVVATAELSDEERKRKVDASLADWSMLGETVSAVKQKRIFLLTEDYTTIPGPRTPLFVEQLREILEGTVLP